MTNGAVEIILSMTNWRRSWRMISPAPSHFVHVPRNAWVQFLNEHSMSFSVHCPGTATSTNGLWGIVLQIMRHSAITEKKYVGRWVSIVYFLASMIHIYIILSYQLSHLVTSKSIMAPYSCKLLYILQYAYLLARSIVYGGSNWRKPHSNTLLYTHSKVIMHLIT